MPTSASGAGLASLVGASRRLPSSTTSASSCAARPKPSQRSRDYPGFTREKESAERIVQGDISAFCASFDVPTSSSETSAGNGLLDTICINSITLEADSVLVEPVFDADKASLHRPKQSSGCLTLLLCPRCTFLASLILASKFMQDRCHSNRPWTICICALSEGGRIRPPFFFFFFFFFFGFRGAFRPLFPS
ncbi:hypothetical protein EV702DRAFT_744581 [Suillus placidus]|uniref:Uncharacterized protein n=1 Tax=Suillus placidus TaxID=48579 RepID=A0A9P6ZIJ8_9AGAM|nr:hypothetical protein EV702DRAFT_744581 [Suillus placidus]